MKVFISWSGEQSKVVATALRESLGIVVQAAKVFFSSEDVRSGQRWFSEIGDQLGETDYGIICLTRENIESRWIHFEAGALGKHVERSRVCCYLVDIEQSDVLQPLSQFHNRLATLDDTRKLLSDLNLALPESDRLNESALGELFTSIMWPKINKALVLAKQLEPRSIQVRRTDSDKLNEMLQLLRSVAMEVERERDPAALAASELRPLLERMEQTGQVERLNEVVKHMDSKTLVRVAEQISCGMLCDVITLTLQHRGHDWFGSH